jgi:HK97 family phage major capsid protein
MNARELRVKLNEKIAEGRALIEAAEKENRDLSSEEQTRYNGIKAEIESLQNRIQRAEELPAAVASGGAPSVLKIRQGDSEERAWTHFFRTGDASGLNSPAGEEERGQRSFELHIPTSLEQRATTYTLAVADSTGSGAADPTGLVNRIAARRNELRLADKLGVQMIPGVGTTVNHAYDNAAAAPFDSTSEQIDSFTNTYTAARPTLATKAFTLVKYTRKVQLTEETLQDEDANLMGFIADWIGREIALTHNNLMLTEVASNGTSLKTFASATAIAAGELENMCFNDTLSWYLDDGGSAAWVTRPSTFGKIKAITGNARMYEELGAGSARGALLEYPVFYSSYATAIAASAKSIYFGNWFYMGMRESPALSFIRDPYTTDGVVYLKYSFRCVYGILIAGAIGYGLHPTG